MRKALLVFWILLPVFLFGTDEVHKPAVLIMPERIEYPTGSGYLLTGRIRLRWDENNTLKINVWRDKKTGKLDQLLREIEVFDEDGKKLNRQFFVSIPPIPDGELSLNQGEYKEFGFFVWNGSVVFPRPGNYYVVATYHDAFVGKTNVVFTTSKCWFRVVEVPPKGRGI